MGRLWHLYSLNLCKCLFSIGDSVVIAKETWILNRCSLNIFEDGDWQYPYPPEDLHKLVLRNPYILMCTWISNCKLVLLLFIDLFVLNLSQFRIIMLTAYKFRCMTCRETGICTATAIVTFKMKYWAILRKCM